MFADPPNAPSRRVPGLLLATLFLLWVATGSTPLGSALASNLTSESYNTALAKWNSLHIVEYEQTVSIGTDLQNWGRWRFVVQKDPTAGDDGERVTQIEKVGVTGKVILDGLAIKSLTVDREFRTMKAFLQSKSEFPAMCDALHIQFDPVMGYPSSYFCDFSDLLCDHCPPDRQIWMVTEDVKVLKHLDGT